MLSLGGLHALDLTTSTPDALCPPIEEARAAVKARVGEVRGDFHAEFSLIRRDDGRRALQLSLREGDAQVLSRELPLDDAGCDDAAQAIALVLERHFDALDQPEAPPAAPKLESVPATPDRAPAQVVSVATTRDARSTPPRRPWRVRAGLLYDWELGLAPIVGVMLYPRALELTPHVRIGAALDVAPFLFRHTQSVREQELTLTTLQAAFSLPVTWELTSWALSLGPWAQLRFQRAKAPAALDGAAAYRALPGVGGSAQAAFELGPRWSVAASFAFGAQIPGSADRFALQKDNGERSAVLVPHSWFAEAGLGAVLRF